MGNPVGVNVYIINAYGDCSVVCGDLVDVNKVELESHNEILLATSERRVARPHRLEGTPTTALAVNLPLAKKSARFPAATDLSVGCSYEAATVVSGRKSGLPSEDAIQIRRSLNFH